MRNGFLLRFAAVLLGAGIILCAGLSYVLAGLHLQAVRNDLVASSIGQASAALQPGLDSYNPSRGLDVITRARLAAAASNIESFQELVRDVRIYAPLGQPLVPPTGKAEASEVQRAIRNQDVVESAPFDRDGDRLITAYIPLAASTSMHYAAVAAIDVSLGQLNVQTQGEVKFVVAATVVAVALLAISLLTLAIAAQRELDKRRRIADSTFLQTMEGIASIVDRRDPYTAGHSWRVAAYSVKVARQLNESKANIESVRWAALLHDLGKIGIPDAVLRKPGPLDADEREVISHHPSIANDILAPVEAMREIAPCVLHHHERWDGKGYPMGLAGEAIPRLSRIIAVADTYDAMTTDRPYRRALPVDEARKRLIEGRGTQWEGQCVDAIVALIDAGTLID